MTQTAAKSSAPGLHCRARRLRLCQSQPGAGAVAGRALAFEVLGVGNIAQSAALSTPPIMRSVPASRTHRRGGKSAARQRAAISSEIGRRGRTSSISTRRASIALTRAAQFQSSSSSPDQTASCRSNHELEHSIPDTSKKPITLTADTPRGKTRADRDSEPSSASCHAQQQVDAAGTEHPHSRPSPAARGRCRPRSGTYQLDQRL